MNLQCDVAPAEFISAMQSLLLSSVLLADIDSLNSIVQTNTTVEVFFFLN